VAGDAAHVHPPQGGQGLNTGVQDAVNLGWKLAQVVRGSSPDALLDSYHDERHPVARRVLDNTQAQVAIATPGARHASLRGALAELLAMDEPRRKVGAMLAGLDVRYDLGGEHPLVGRRMPDADLATAGGSARTYELLRDPRHLLLCLDGPVPPSLADWAERVQLVDASCPGPWELPLVGRVDAPEAVLVRPDGHVAWVGRPTDPTLLDALERWVGRPASAPA
jgi:3-(3-hydroxy-phenyl)propionate hydroxylase